MLAMRLELASQTLMDCWVAKIMSVTRSLSSVDKLRFFVAL